MGRPARAASSTKPGCIRTRRSNNPCGRLLTVGDAQPDGGDLPISIGFRPIASVTYPDGILRTKVELTEVICRRRRHVRLRQLDDARGHLPPPMSWKSRDPRKDRLAV